MAEIRYTKSHEWCSLQGDLATCGISKHAAAELNDLTFLDYRAAPGKSVAQGETMAEVDSVKATSEIYAPVAGKVEAINERFKEESELAVITRDPEGEGWLFKLRVSDPAQLQGLMDAAAYAKFCAEAAH